MSRCLPIERDVFDDSARYRVVHVYARQCGVHRLEANDGLAGERTVERAGRAEYRVPFGHRRFSRAYPLRVATRERLRRRLRADGARGSPWPRD